MQEIPLNELQIPLDANHLLWITNLVVSELETELEPISQKARKLFRHVKPFLISLHLKTERCTRLELLVWKEPLLIFRIHEQNSSVIIRFETLLRLCGCENFLEPSRNGPLEVFNKMLCYFDFFFLFFYSRKQSRSLHQVQDQET